MNEFSTNSNKVFLRTNGLKKGLFPFTQEEILNALPEFDRNSSRIISKLFKSSSISTRYSIFENLTKSNFGDFNFEKISNLSTATRNNLYRRFAPKLFYAAAKEMIAELDELDHKKITHIITVSCTGCYSPGPGDELIKTLDLEKNVERIHVGFMGCYAGLAAIRIASSIAQTSYSAIVLIVCVELSSLHWRKDTSDDNKLSLSLFADGASTAIVSQKKFSKCFEIIRVASELIPGTEDEMAWHMGENGFEMTLSREVPYLLEKNLMESVISFITPIDIDLSMIDHWAVHPGGSKILKLLSEKFSLKTKIDSSWKILDNFGNMSSATILYVLEDVLLNSEFGSNVISLAFGPGLTVEKTMLKVA